MGWVTVFLRVLPTEMEGSRPTRQKTVTHPSTNRAPRIVTSLIRHGANQDSVGPTYVVHEERRRAFHLKAKRSELETAIL